MMGGGSDGATGIGNSRLRLQTSQCVTERCELMTWTSFEYSHHILASLFDYPIELGSSIFLQRGTIFIFS